MENYRAVPILANGNNETRQNGVAAFGRKPDKFPKPMRRSADPPKFQNCSLQSLAMDFRIGAAIQNGFDEDRSGFFGIVNGIRKPFGKQAVIARSFRVNSGI